MAKTRDRGHNDIRLDLFQIIVIETKVVHDTGRKIIHHHITLLDELFDNLYALRFGDVEEQTFLAHAPLVENTGAIHPAFHILRVNRQPTGNIHPCV